MKINEIMTPECRSLHQDESIAAAAQIMSEDDIGVVPVTNTEKIVGMLTDRDIVIRGIAEGRNAAQTRAGELMSDKVYYCYDDEECEKVAANMGELQVRRMPVVNRDKQLVGMVSLGDFAARGAKEPAGAALSEISAAR